jgi:cytochrome P450
MSADDLEIDIANPDTYRDGYPHGYFRRLLREDPVHWNPPGDRDCSLIAPITTGHWAVTKHADVVEVSRNPRLFSSHAGSIFIHDVPEDMLAGMRLMLINTDPPHHTQQRRILQTGFTPKMVARLEPSIASHAARVVDEVAKGGSCDFVNDLAVEMPLVLICELMGIPQEDRYQVFSWAEQMVGADDPDLSSPEKMQAASAAAFAYGAELAAQRRLKPDDTLMSDFVHAEFEGRSVGEADVAFFFTLLLAAGTETTQTATAAAMRLLSSHPDQRALLLSDIDRYLPTSIEEVLRFEPPVLFMRRTATENTELRGKQIKAGDKVVLIYPAANRDEDVFEAPDVFDITRRPNPHLSFGIGQHFCLGASLARMQLRCILGEIYKRLPDIEVSGPVVRQRGNVVNGYKRMPVRFSTAD